MIMKTFRHLFTFFVIIVIWQVLAELKLINTLILPAPGRVWTALVEQLKTGILLQDMASSVKRVIVGFVMAAALGVSLGVVSGYSQRFSSLLRPLFEFLRPIPPIAWIPIAILWFGLGDTPAYFIVFVGAFFPVYIHTFWGIRSSRQTYVNVALNFGANSLMTLIEVVLPASLPDILKGLRIGLGLAWTSVISAELVGAQSGLGYMIQLNRIMLKTQNIIVGMVAIGFLGYFMNFLMGILEKKLIFWKHDTMQAHEDMQEAQ